MEEELVFRLFFIGVFAVGLSISTDYRRLARKSGEAIARSREGALALILRAVMAIPFRRPGVSIRDHPSRGRETDRGLRRGVCSI
jgi:hypothetical protein